MPRHLLALLVAASAVAGEAAPDPLAALAGLRQGHPRLLLTDQRLAELKQLAATDPLLRKCVADVIARADKDCAAKPLQRVLTGPRLLSVSRDCLGRVLNLGLAWRWTCDPRYLAAGRRALLDVAAFSDWNPPHFLDVAEMGTAVAIGLDWMWPGLDAEARTAIHDALLRRGLDPGVVACGGWQHDSIPAWWCGTDCNWNQVCHGGLIVAALAVADSDPRYIQRLLPQAVDELPRALANYGSDGVWPEGPGYWAYATDYTIFALSSLDTALGTTLGLDRSTGLRRTGSFPVSAQGATGLLPNFADVGDHCRFSGNPTLLWLSGHFEQPGLTAVETAVLASHPAQPLDVAWYRPATASQPIFPLDQRFDGPVQLAVFRSAWNDPDALYAYIKAGFNRVNHGHLDLGSFEFDLLGQRWARDLGSDNYNLPGYFSGGPGGKRWDYFRLNSHSHSVTLVDDHDQSVDGKAAIIAFAGSDAPHAVVDLSSAWPQAASRAQRGLALVDGRTALLVQDEFALRGSHDLTWGMTTDAAIEVAGQTAALSLNGRHIAATILSPPGASFSIASAERKAPEKANADVRRLEIRLPGASGEVRIAVLLGPAQAAAPAVRPLAAW